MTHLHWWLRFAGEWSLIAALMAVATAIGPWSWLPVAWLVGTRQHALAVIGHMGSHRLCGPGSELLAWLCFAPMGGDMRRYRSAHLAHHRAIGVPGIDPEVAVAQQFRARWERRRRRDLWLDLFGLHADEMARIMRDVGSPVSIAAHAGLTLALWALFGPAPAVVWAVGPLTGLMAAQRCRARTEHDHLNHPGLTFTTPRPPLWRRALYLPHGTWMHAEHHAAWAARNRGPYP